MIEMGSRVLVALFAAAAIASSFFTGTASGESVTAASDWVEGFNNKARLIAGAASRNGANDALFAGVEIVMPAGWKTYWRAPGEAGGIPPEFDWSGSENLDAATVLYPAPHRLADKAGDSIGYKDRVVFPVAISVKDASKPVRLNLKAVYGVCKDICIPAEAEIALSVPSGAGASADLDLALVRVPGVPDAAKDPVLVDWRVENRDAKPKLILEVTDAGGAGGDAFVDIADGTFMPLPKKVSEGEGKSTYEIDLTDGVDFAALKGKTVRVTLTGTKGQSEATLKIE